MFAGLIYISGQFSGYVFISRHNISSTIVIFKTWFPFVTIVYLAIILSPLINNFKDNENPSCSKRSRDVCTPMDQLAVGDEAVRHAVQLLIEEALFCIVHDHSAECSTHPRHHRGTYTHRAIRDAKLYQLALNSPRI